MPASRECTCHVCVPGDLESALDEKVVHDVREYGVHVMGVHEGDGPDEPSFAYTVGLWHHSRHPELLMTGQRIELMHRALNAAVAWVRAGHRLTPGRTVEGVLGGFPVAVEELTARAVGETVTFSAWFHRRPVPAVQLVWPDLDGIWPWQPGAHELSRERQPEAWRLPSERAGALAVDPAWVMPVPADTLVISCSHLSEGALVARAVREPSPERGEDWQVLCDADHSGLTSDDIHLVHLSHLVRSAPSLRELADLEPGQEAWRADPWQPWSRAPVVPDEPVRPRRRWRRRGAAGATED